MGSSDIFRKSHSPIQLNVFLLRIVLLGFFLLVILHLSATQPKGKVYKGIHSVSFPHLFREHLNHAVLFATSLGILVGSVS